MTAPVANTAGKALNAAGAVSRTATRPVKAAKSIAPSYGHDATMPLVVGTIVVVGLGSVFGDHKVNGKAIMAGGIVMFGLSALDNVNSKISAGFAAIMFVGSCTLFLPKIVEELGFSGGKTGNDIDFSKATAKPSSISTDTPASSTAPAIATNGQTPAGTQQPGTATPQNSGGTIKT